MFEKITEKFSEAIRTLKGTNKISKENIKAATNKIERILEESDINTKIIKELINEIEEAALGTEVPKNLTPEQVFIKIVNDKLVKLITCENHNILFSNKTIITVCGLQGAGKTTFVHKLGKYIKTKYKKKPLLVAGDIYRPAAIEQLEILAEKNNLDYFKKENERDVIKIISESIDFSTKNQNDVIIIDTAGRTTSDNDMMSELKKISDNFNITESLLVLDGMIGQLSVKIAEAFNEVIKITGVILTKMDGDSTGGVALSIAKTINKPIKFLSTGEKIDDIEEFHPERIVNRILGMGDIVSLVEKIKNSEIKQNENLFKKKFTYETFKEQIISLEKLGGINSLKNFLPIGLVNSADSEDNTEKFIKKIIYIIDSMNKNEKCGYSRLDLSRKIRIAKGSGTSIDDVNKLIKLYENASNLLNNKLKNQSFLKSVLDKFRM